MVVSCEVEMLLLFELIALDEALDRDSVLGLDDAASSAARLASVRGATTRAGSDSERLRLPSIENEGRRRGGKGGRDGTGAELEVLMLFVFVDVRATEGSADLRRRDGTRGDKTRGDAALHTSPAR